MLYSRFCIRHGSCRSGCPGQYHVLAGADRCRCRRDTSRPCPPRRGHSCERFPLSSLLVLVPAHDEALVLDASLASLAQQYYPAPGYEILVVADNCTDTTADIARARGATVWERTNPDQRGKGYALDWAIARLLARPVPPDACIVIDADTWAAPDFLTQINARLLAQTDDRGLCALQGRYGVLNEAEGWRAALMSAAFDLVNHVRPLGRDRLGLSVGLKGNGMAFTRETLARVRWHGDSLTEDLDFALDLARTQNLRVGYAPEARVWAQMPTEGAQAASQRKRWEQGRRHSLRTCALPSALGRHPSASPAADRQRAGPAPAASGGAVAAGLCLAVTHRLRRRPSPAAASDPGGKRQAGWLCWA